MQQEWQARSSAGVELHSILVASVSLCVRSCLLGFMLVHIGSKILSWLGPKIAQQILGFSPQTPCTAGRRTEGVSRRCLAVEVG